MKKITVNIIDDEQDGRDYIALLLANEFPELEVTFYAANVASAYRQLVKKQPDILFLDVQLGDGDAFDLLGQLTTVASRIIFITAYEHYAIKAIRNNAVDYLLKPIRKNEFIAAVRKAIDFLQKERQPRHASQAPKISLPTAQGFKNVSIADITRCEADSNYTRIFLTDRSRILVSRTLQDFEEQFLPHNFFRIHHKHLINLLHFRQYIKGKGGQVILSDESVVDVSVRRKAEFLDRIFKTS